MAEVSKEKELKTFKQQLRSIGISDEQIDKIIQLIQRGVKTDGPLSSTQVLAITNSPQGFLPNIPLNIDPRINVGNLSIKNVAVSQKTTVGTNNIDLSGLAIGDFSLDTIAPDPVTLDKAEVTQFKILPLSIPSLTLENLGTEILSPRLGATQIPLEFKSESGGADINVPIVDEHPRFNARKCIDVLWWTICFRIEFGFDITIALYYRWVITLLQVGLSIQDAYARSIRIRLGIAKLVFTNLRVGLLKFAKLVWLCARIRRNCQLAET